MEFLSDRISVVRNEKGTSIVISSMADRKKSRTVAIILLFWVIGGIAMVFGFPSITEDKAKIVMIIWLAFWLYFLYVLVRLWRWKRHGHEVMKINEGVLKYKKDVKGRGWVFDFQLDKIQKLRASEAENPNWLRNIGGDFWNTDCDSVRFNYEDREMSIGFQLDKSDRAKLINVLSEFVAAEKEQSKRSQKENNWKKKED